MLSVFKWTSCGNYATNDLVIIASATCKLMNMVEAETCLQKERLDLKTAFSYERTEQEKECCERRCIAV